MTKGDAIFLKSCQYWKQSIGKCVTLCHPKNQPTEKSTKSLDCGDNTRAEIEAAATLMMISVIRVARARSVAGGPQRAR
jgi:hypothetical protein